MGGYWQGFLTGAFKSPDDIPEGDARRGIPRFQGVAFEEVNCLHFISNRFAACAKVDTRISN